MRPARAFSLRFAYRPLLTQVHYTTAHGGNGNLRLAVTTGLACRFLIPVVTVVLSFARYLRARFRCL